MSRFVYSRIAIALVALGSVSASWGTPTWHTATIRSVYPLASGAFVLTFASDSPSCTNANSPHYYRVEVGQNGVTAEAARNMYGLALAAATTGKPVTINFESNTANCFINRMAVNFT